MNENETNTNTQKDYEEKFKNALFKAFSERNPEVYRDEDGFIVIPRVRRRRKTPPNKSM